GLHPVLADELQRGNDERRSHVPEGAGPGGRLDRSVRAGSEQLVQQLEPVMPQQERDLESHQLQVRSLRHEWDLQLLVNGALRLPTCATTAHLAVHRLPGRSDSVRRASSTRVINGKKLESYACCQSVASVSFRGLTAG